MGHNTTEEIKNIYCTEVGGAVYHSITIRPVIPNMVYGTILVGLV